MVIFRLLGYFSIFKKLFFPRWRSGRGMAASAATVQTADGVLPWTKANNICQYAKVQIFVVFRYL